MSTTPTTMQFAVFPPEAIIEITDTMRGFRKLGVVAPSGLAYYDLLGDPSGDTAFPIYEAMQPQDVGDLTDSLRGLFHLVAMVSVMTVGVMCAIGYRFGFRNHYGEAVARMIRQQCNTPTEGEIHLSKVTRDAASLEGATPAV